MSIELDIDEFVNHACVIANKYLPENMNDEDKEFVLQCINNCAIRTAKVLSTDKSLQLNREEIIYVGYIILEWIFKVVVALVESDIEKEFRHGIILDTGYIAFDITKDICKIPDITRNQIFNTGEYHVVNKLKEILDKHVSDGLVSESQRDSFLNHYYINKSEKRIEFALNK